MSRAPRAGLILLAIALHLAVVSFIMYFSTYDAFHFVGDKWVVALMVIALWSIVGLIVNSFIGGNKPLFVDALYIIAVFALVIAAVKFFTPCLSPIGIYFTVHNMGDVEANAIGVPRSIVGISFFVATILFVVVSAFFARTKHELLYWKKTDEDEAHGEEAAALNDEVTDTPEEATNVG